MRHEKYKTIRTTPDTIAATIENYRVSAEIEGMQIVLDAPTDYGHDMILDHPRTSTRYRIAIELWTPAPEPLTANDVTPDDHDDLLAAFMYGLLEDQDIAAYL